MKRHQHRLGATAVEFAIAAVALFLIVFGAIEVTRISMLRHTADHAAYLAARDAIIAGADTADARAAAENHLATIGVNSAVVSISPNPINDATSSVEVTVSIPVASNSLVVPQFISGTITGRSQLLTERTPTQMAVNLPTPPAPPSTSSGSTSPSTPSQPKPPPPPPPLL